MNKAYLFRITKLFTALLVAGFFYSCDDDSPAADEDPIASFDFTPSTTNFLEVTFINVSQNATSYEWDFGDGSPVSNDFEPTHEFTGTGDWTVTLTATNDAGDSDTFMDVISVTDPDEALTLLAGVTSKTWIVQREEIAIYLGPEQIDMNGNVLYNGAWFTFGEPSGNAAPLASRPCVLDDEYTFFRDGSFQNNTNGTFFMDQEQFGGWNDNIGEGCTDETTPDALISSTGRDYTAFANGGAYTYEYDVPNSSLKLIGEGAYIALPKLQNAGDIGPDGTVAPELTYEVGKLVDGPVADSLQIVIGGQWLIMMVSYENPQDQPDIPTLLPDADFSFTNNGTEVTFTNLSNDAAINFNWDFGDGVTSTDENPVHTYASLGTYDVTLDTDDGNGNMATITKEITVANPITSLNYDFTTTVPTFGVFGGTDDQGTGVAVSVIANPDATGVNTTADVAQLDEPDASRFYTGISTNMGGAIDFTNKQDVKVKVWSPIAGATVKLKFESSANPADSKEIDQTITNANTWEELTYTFAPEDANKWDVLVLFFDFDPNGDQTNKAGARTYYFDEITF